MRAQTKSAARLLRKHLVRLLTIAAIVFVGVGFMSGVGEVEESIKTATEKFYRAQNVSDFYIKSTQANGFSAQQRDYLQETFGTQNVRFAFCYETQADDELWRVYTLDVTDTRVDPLALIEGTLPAAPDEILAERATKALQGYAVGDVVSLNGNAYTVCGIVRNPLLLNMVEEASFAFEGKSLDRVLYVHADVAAWQSGAMAVNDAFVTLSDRKIFRAFDKTYNKTTKRVRLELQTVLGDTVTVLRLYDNVGLYGMVYYAEKVGLISAIFVVFFLLVIMLIVYANMSRMFEEERAQIACLKTLGYSDFSIVRKYCLFVLAGTLIGGLLALPVGKALTFVVYKAFRMQYAMPPFPGFGRSVYYLATFASIIAVTLSLTYACGMQLVRHEPVTLLARKAPKSGKKVILEHVGFLWKRLSFKYKSAFRNVLLFKSRFFMTVISIIGSTVLVLAGFGLLDCATKQTGAQSIMAIAAALIVFSALLCALVIYNLTTINVSERNREIATLMVLGYHDREVTGYVFREIYIMSILGAILGVPLGLGFLRFVFQLVNFGAIADINWWSWILAPAATVFFCFLSTLLLRRKILRTDMNTSLKILE